MVTISGSERAKLPRGDSRKFEFTPEYILSPQIRTMRVCTF